MKLIATQRRMLMTFRNNEQLASVLLAAGSRAGIKRHSADISPLRIVGLANVALERLEAVSERIEGRVR